MWYFPEGYVLLGFCYIKTCKYFFFTFEAVLASSSCYNEVPQTGWHINNRNLFYTVLEARSPGSWYQPGQVLVFSASWFTDGYLSIVLSHGGEQRQEVSVYSLSSSKSTNPVHENANLMTRLPPKVPTAKCYHTGDQISTHKLAGVGARQGPIGSWHYQFL